MTRYRHFFEAGAPLVWVSDEPHAYGLLRIKNSTSTDIGGEGLLKAFKASERDIAIEYAKGQRDLEIHRGFKLKLVRLNPEEFVPTAPTGGRSGGSHADCDHPATPAARRECRARRKAGIA